MPDEPVQTTLEEARRCAKCKQPGVFVGKRLVRPRPGIKTGTYIHNFRCENTRCRWYMTICRSVQVNPDGSIPEPVTRREREFPKVPDLTDKVNAQVRALLDAEKQGGAEI